MLPHVGTAGETLAAELRLVARLCRKSGYALLHALSITWSGVRDGWRMMAAYEALARLSDDDLARRSLRREDIPRAALAVLDHPAGRPGVRR
jgi:hypothetical protein